MPAQMLNDAIAPPPMTLRSRRLFRNHTSPPDRLTYFADFLTAVAGISTFYLKCPHRSAMEFGKMDGGGRNGFGVSANGRGVWLGVRDEMVESRPLATLQALME
jgi:hypothetical protein